MLILCVSGGQCVVVYMSFDYATTRMLGIENHVCELQVVHANLFQQHDHMLNARSKLV